MTKILIATPSYGDVYYTPYVSSVLKLVRLMKKRNWDFYFASISYSEIAESRNYLLTYWFDKTDASHILFVDADMGFDPQLVIDMVLLDKPVVGVIYPKRNIKLDRVAELAAQGEPLNRAIGKSYQYVFRPLAEGRQIKPKVQSGFVQVEACGTGIMLIQRSCIKTMLELIPSLSDTDKKSFSLVPILDRLIRAFDILRAGGHRLSEDYSFCYRWRQMCKGEIWASISHQVTHIGLQEFTARYSDSLPGVTTGRLPAPGKLRAKREREEK